jgi:hypothetical protein
MDSHCCRSQHPLCRLSAITQPAELLYKRNVLRLSFHHEERGKRASSEYKKYKGLEMKEESGNYTLGATDWWRQLVLSIASIFFPPCTTALIWHYLLYLLSLFFSQQNHCMEYGKGICSVFKLNPSSWRW